MKHSALPRDAQLSIPVSISVGCGAFSEARVANDNDFPDLIARDPIADNVWKRSVDLIGATALLILLGPLLLITALIIMFDSKGPALFRQRRTGLEGQVFRIYKFRTMRVLEDGGHIVQATRTDPRVTRIGRFLRRTSIDELPQLINVLKGEMSLVGPRPHAAAHDAYYRTRLQAYDRRFTARPGITGLAQVRGFRGETGTIDLMAQRLASDLDYIDSWSLQRDLVLLVKSAALFFSSHGH
jgi:putative colanic acid biosynthesis UDP-glucose lipid carrier transferase